ncbi:hypothetical protein G7Z17_g10966 [Cylindrodendrum hubeiense]|uniref:Peptidase S8/S53 domain-containing protein n=1 Tax=Cylindrodendrum hubeiense TaxID=595255 RepID=A0A9P5H1Y5_9HYPO|nr:hypothetical protein G7Z17_g10966 [Cylindrodendrum hubeiense]
MQVLLAGPGGAGGDSPFDFAKDALSRVSQIAVELGARKKLCVAGCLAAELLIARKALDSADVAQLPKLQRRVPKLLKDLERWPEPPDPYNSILRSVVSVKGNATEDRVRQGLISFSKASPYVIEQYLKKLEKFSKSVVVTDDNDRISDKAKRGDRSTVEEYPAHVNTDLYAILRLRDDIVKVNGHVAFDMLFSASPTGWDHWQDLQLRLPLKKARRGVKFDDGDSCKILPNCPNRVINKTRVVPPEEFCSLVKTKLGSQICCHIQDSELHQLYDGFPIAQNVNPGPSFSLRKVLEIRRLSNRMKLVLAYIVARSFWRYYDSPWMDSQWTSDSIHFLPESPVEDEAHSGDALYASKPYFAVEFEDHGGQSMEYCSSFGVIFRYPRLLALCIMLLEIGRGQSLAVEDYGSAEANLNETWTLAKRLTNKNRTWGDFDYPHYRKAILGCLNYTPSSEESGSVDTDVFARKAAIYDDVVQPLEKLLKELGFAENLHILDPIDTIQGPGRVLDIPAVLALPTENRDASQSARWLDEVNTINRYIQRQASFTSARAPRVAILDTGFDDEAIFFNGPGRRGKIKGWRDWAGDEESPVDENGHGSHTMALVMKVAPNAMIYAARIAKNRGSLKNATQSIVEAIHWAAIEMKADIISMSFGFQEEIPIITTAITEAILERKGNIIFLAAASNSGGNRREMFPANLDSVISIRETNSRGAFSDTNPPVDLDGPAAFGTLGREVPSAWLSSVDGEVAKSGSSVATAMAAGIAAMVLTFVSVGMETETAKLPVEVQRVWTKRGMRAALTRMSQNMGNRSYFISPMAFFASKDAEKAWAAIADACVG